MTSIIPGYDVTGANFLAFIAAIPKPPAVALYVTGSNGVPATTAMLERFPDALRITQTGSIDTEDKTADYIDVEQYAATPEIAAEWCADALNNWHAGTRPGQRTPCVYGSQSSLTSIANALVAAHLDNGSIGLIVANWNLTGTQADTEVLDANGPFPIRGVQFKSDATYDFDVWSLEWFNNQSGKLAPPASQSGTQHGWAACTKCAKLYYVGWGKVAHCPAGGLCTYDPQGYNYGLEWTVS